MEPAAPGLDEVVELLGRWRGASGPAARLQTVTEAARVLRDLPSTDSRVLARQLFEHGAPDAAQKIAQQTGGAVSADQLNDAAYALLSVDQRELDGLAGELRDPEQRRRIVEDAGVALRAATDTAPPPEPEGRLEMPPPPGAQAPRVGTAVSDTDGAVSGPDGSAPSGDDGAIAVDEGGDAPDALAGDARAAGGTAASAAMELTDGASGPSLRRSDGAAPVTPRRRTDTTPVSRFVEALSGAANVRERLALLDEHPMDLDHDQLVDVLQAVPDGWQRRTVLRKLLTAGRIDPLVDASDVVTAFARRSDRFAVAASLTRSGIADVVPLLAHVDPSDARRLRLRYTT